MDLAGRAKQVRIYLNEGDTAGRQPAYLAVLELLRREHCAGATVTRGIVGFTRGRIQTAQLVELSSALPIVIDWVDSAERVERLLPALAALASDALITVQEVGVAQFPRRALEDVPADLRVRDVMTPAARVVTAGPDADLHDLVTLLLRRGRHAVPVLDPAGRVVGIITNRDLVGRVGLPLRLELLRALGDPADSAVAAHLAGLRGAGRTAASIMTGDVATIGPDAPVADAAALMLKRRLKRLPVVDAGRRLLGMVSRIDVLRAVSRVSPAPDRAGEVVPDGLVRAPRAVGEVMQRQVPVVRPDAPLAEVLDAVVSTRLNRAVVADEAGRPVGIVVDADLMQRVTPGAHPGLIRRLMHQFRPESPAEREAWQRLTGQRAADVMRPREKMVVVPADTPIAEVIDRSLAQQSKLITVVDDQGRVVGMADRADLLAALAAAV